MCINTVMKKLLLIVLMLSFIGTSMDAQFLQGEELENYAKEKYGKKWVDAAEKIGENLWLDKNNSLT